MQIRTPHPYKDLLLRKLHGLIHRLENNGNSDFTHNGEEHFIQDLSRFYNDSPCLCFDIGANKGEYTNFILTYLKNNVAIHLFEPQSSCLKTLKELYGKNQRVHINDFGLSDTSTIATLHKDNDGSGLASLYKRDLEHIHINMDLTEKISLKRGDAYIKEHNIHHIHLLKIDVEGHEISALKGFGDFFNAEHIDFVQFEYGGANLDSHTSLLELFNFFEQRGFRVAKMMRTHLELHTYDQRFENFIYQNYVAISPRILQ